MNDLKSLAKLALQKMHLLSKQEQMLLLQELQMLEDEENTKKVKTSFLEFVKAFWPGFIGGQHHKLMTSAAQTFKWFNKYITSKVNCFFHRWYFSIGLPIK